MTFLCHLLLRATSFVKRSLPVSAVMSFSASALETLLLSKQEHKLAVATSPLIFNTSSSHLELAPGLPYKLNITQTDELGNNIRGEVAILLPAGAPVFDNSKVSNALAEKDTYSRNG